MSDIKKVKVDCEIRISIGGRTEALNRESALRLYDSLGSLLGLPPRNILDHIMHETRTFTS